MAFVMQICNLHCLLFNDIPNEQNVMVLKVANDWRWPWLTERIEEVDELEGLVQVQGTHLENNAFMMETNCD